MNNSAGAKITNYFPDSDCVEVEIDDHRVTISRDELGAVHIKVDDMTEGTSAMIVLGEDGYTQKV